MRINEVRTMLKTWKQRLGLGPWKIDVKWTNLEDEHGNVEFDVLHRIAVIGINKPALLPQAITVEYVLVHELLHLVLIELELVEKAKTDQKDMTLERVINQLTNALLEQNKQ